MNVRSRAAQRPLDILNLALVDVNGAIKPYLNVFLYVHRDWADATVGLIGTISGLFGLALQTPLGAAADAVADKRILLLAALILLSVGAVLFGVSPHFWPVLVGSCVLAAVAGLLNPLVAALTLVVTPRRRLTRRLGRNAAFERAGNVAIAIAIGAVGYLLPDRAVFLLVPALSIVAGAALYAVPPAPAREETAGTTTPAVPRFAFLKRSAALPVFAVCAGLFHFANGPLLTLVAQNISRDHPRWSSVVISVCIVGAQAVMVPMAMLVGHRADRWGRKPLLVAAFLALPLRAVLYTASHAPAWLIAVQLLDGIGAGLLSAAKPLVVADLTAGTGHYNLASGLVGTMQGIGASLSFVAAGYLVERIGFDAAYLMSGLVALAALALLVVAMPETAPRETAPRETAR